MAELRMEHIYKFYDQKEPAVDDFNLHIADKEFIVFVGPSGCGNQRRCGWSQDLKKFRKAIFILKENGSMM